MVISVTIPDSVAAEAEARGLTPERYVEQIIAAQRVIPKAVLPVKTQEQRMADLEKFFEEFSANSENIPRLPDEAFTRESFYSDHD